MLTTSKLVLKVVKVICCVPFITLLTGFMDCFPLICTCKTLQHQMIHSSTCVGILNNSCWDVLHTGICYGMRSTPLHSNDAAYDNLVPYSFLSLNIPLWICSIKIYCLTTFISNLNLNHCYLKYSSWLLNTHAHGIFLQLCSVLGMHGSDCFP